MFDSYKIAVRVALIDEVAGPLSMIARSFARAEGSALALEKRLKSIRQYFIGGTALMGTGAAFAAPIVFAIDKAALLQKEMIGIQSATGATAGAMDGLRRTIEKTASVTMFSNIDVAKMAKVIETGIGAPVPQLASLLPIYAKFADVQQLLKGTPYEQSVAEAVRLAHTAQHYDPKSLAAYLDLLTKASFIVPGDLSEVGHALKYSQGIGKTALGINDTDMILMTALLNRLGFAGSRGGTNLIAAMTRTVPGVFGSGLMAGRSREALTDMGMVDAAGNSRVFRNGRFDMFEWMGLLSQFVQREFASHPGVIARQNILRDFQFAFGTQGSRVASLLSSPQALQQLRSIGLTFAQRGGVEDIQSRFANESVYQQWVNAKTNFVSAMTELGITLLPTVSTGLRSLNSELGTLIGWMQQNPGKVKEYAKDLAIFSGALVGLGAVSVTTSAVLGLTTVIGALGKAGKAAVIGGTGPGMFGRLARGTPILGAVALGFDEYFKRFHALDSWSNLGQALQGLFSQAPPIVTGVGSPVTVHTQINLDGRKVAETVSKHQARAAAQPQTGPGIFDGRMMPVPAGGVGF